MILQGRRKRGGRGGSGRPTFHANFFFRRRFNFRVPRYHAPLERSVRVRRGPRHYELAVCLISACMEFFCVMLVHDLQCSEMLREQLLYRHKNKSQKFFALRATLSGAARFLTSRPMAAPPFQSFRRACTIRSTFMKDLDKLLGGSFEEFSALNTF